MNAREKRIYALAQKWAKRHGNYVDGYSGSASERSFLRAETYNKCGRALLKLFKESGK